MNKLDKILTIVGSIVGGLIVMVVIVVMINLKKEKDKILKFFYEYLKVNNIILERTILRHQYAVTILLTINVLLDFPLGDNSIYLKKSPSLPCNLYIFHKNIRILIPKDKYNITTDNLVTQNNKISFFNIQKFIISHKEVSISSN